MAKKVCNVCKRTYEDGLASCPYCAKTSSAPSGKPEDELLPLILSDVKETAGGKGPLASDSEIDLDALTSAANVLEGASGTIDLAPSPDPASGASKVSWASLVKEKEESSEIDFGIEPPVKFDAVSDADLIAKSKQQGLAPVASASPPAGSPPVAPPPPPALGPANLPPPVVPTGKSLLSQPPAAAQAGSAPGQGSPAMDSPTQGVPTMMAPSKGAPTMLAPSKGAPTQLAPQTTGGPTMLAPRTAQPTMLAPATPQQTQLAPEDKAVLPIGKPTMLAPKTPAPTMLAPSAVPTQMAPPPAPTTLAPVDEMEKEAQSIVEEPAAAGPSTMGASAGLADVLQEWFADGKRPPAKDPIAESVESSVDLGPSKEGVGPTSSGELARALLEGNLDTLKPESSAVDLDRPGTPDQPLSTTGSADLAKQLAEGEESSAVDLGSHPSLELPFTGDSDQKGVDRPQLGPDGQPAHVGSDPSLELSPSGMGLAATTQESTSAVGLGEEVPVDDNRLSQIGRAAAAAAREPRVKPKYGRRWVAGGMIGLLLGSAACAALWVTGNEPFTRARRAQLAEMIGLSVPQEPEDGEDNSPMGQINRHLRAGNPDQAWELIKQQYVEDGDNAPELLAARGEARWLQYMREQKGVAKKSDAAVKEAISDLTKANTPQAYLWLGYIHKATGDKETARKMFNKGKSLAEQAQKPRFDMALIQMELEEPLAEPETRLPRPGEDLEARMELILVLLTQLQAGGEGEEAEEAGFAFWKAAQAARKGDYDTARKLLSDAKKIHQKNRFVRLRKAQNPNSDPTEEIFLRACDELDSYWQMREKLEKGGYPLAKNKGPVGALDALLADKDRFAKVAEGGGDVLIAIAKALGIKEEKPDVKEVLKKVEELENVRKTTEKVQAALADAKYITDEQKDLLKGLDAALKDAAGKKDADEKVAKIGKRLEKAGIKEEDPEKGIEALAAARDDLQQTLLAIAKKLQEAEYLKDAKVDRKSLLEAVDLTIEATQSPLVAALARMGSNFNSLRQVGANTVSTIDLAGRLGVAQGQLARAQLLLRESRTAPEMMDVWMELLEGPTTKEMLDKAALDVRRVNQDKGAGAATRAAARAVQGLIQRHQGKYDEARTSLAEALKAPDLPKGWPATARKVLRELSDPTAAILPQADNYEALNQLERALDVLNAGAQIFPKDGQVLARRALVRLELARRNAKGRLTAKDAGVAEAQKDAEAAVAAGAAGEGNYALGRIAEETRNLARAEENYRAAIAAHPANDAAGSRYRVALGRVLLLRRPLAQPVGQLPPGGDHEAPAQRADALRSPQALALLVLLTTGLQVEPEEAMPDVDQALRLAEEAIKAGNYEGYLIKAQALARKGRWTQALQEYTRGMELLARSGQRLKPEWAAGLRFLTENHPAFKRPDSLNPPDPVLAEKHFAAGLRAYNARRWAEAEQEFIQAVTYHDQDARYLYYLGLSRLPQGKRVEAAEDFRQGAMLERQNKPAPPVVSFSLERVQGPMRQTLNSYRP